jgi:hypothetical protein
MQLNWALLGTVYGLNILEILCEIINGLVPRNLNTFVMLTSEVIPDAKVSFPLPA